MASLSFCGRILASIKVIFQVIHLLQWFYCMYNPCKKRLNCTQCTMFANFPCFLSVGRVLVSFSVMRAWILWWENLRIMSKTSLRMSTPSEIEKHKLLYIIGKYIRTSIFLYMTKKGWNITWDTSCRTGQEIIWINPGIVVFNTWYMRVGVGYL